MPDFVHLHVHSHYSVLDGLCKLPQLVDRTAELGMGSVALTDHGNLFGAVEFQKTCAARQVDPIFGCQLSVIHDQEHRPCHLVLLCKTLAGYRNLVRLISQAHLETLGNAADRLTASGEPFATLDQVAQHASGLLALTADLGGAIPQAFLRGQSKRAAELLDRYREIFGPDDVYLELQRHPGLPEQEVANQGLIELSQRTGTPLVATADVHYVRPEHADAHAVLNCIAIDKRVDLSDLERLPVRDLYLRSPAEMAELFADLPEAVSNTAHVAERCRVTIPLGEVTLPRYEVPAGYDIASFFRECSAQGLDARLEALRRRGRSVDETAYRERLDHEVGIIEEMGYPGYFLIVWDFIRYARERSIPVGPGRGSGAGSLVAYSLGITNIDPLEYGLLFERFLNPERVSMPDFDIDFCMHRRGEVIDYVTQRYGADNVGQIVTFGQLKARASVRDVARVLNFSYSEADRLAKLIPADLGMTLDKALKEERRIRDAVEQDERVARLFELARAVEGTNRNTGIHAAGVVISDDPLWELVPITRGVNGELVTQFAKDEVELAGLVKFDFLGLRNLTVIDHALRLINEQRPPDTPPLDIDAIELDDPAVYALIASGDTAGVFQLESSGFQEMLRKLRPTCFEDIIAAGALYRPGPMGSGMIDDFIACKQGLKEPEYPHPWVEDVLRETHGVIVYQEQVMQIAQILAGYSLGEADLLRRAMGKKKAEVMRQQRAVFLEGSRQRGVDEQVAGRIFDLMAAFAGYGFNKSHSAAYGLVTYQTAYLKTHHPVHFMAALMTADAERTERVVRLIHEAKGRGILVLPPDVNSSRLDFTVSEGAIRFGLGAVKGVGQGAIECIVEARQAGPFESLYDFCERVDLHRVNRRVLETLVKCGAFDSLADRPLPATDLDTLGAWRAAAFAATPAALARGQKAQQDREIGQASLALFEGPSAAPSVHYPDAEPWSDQVLLEAEKECLGFYVSGHPLDRYESELHLYTTHNCQSLERASERDEVRLGGVVAEIRERRSKSGTGRHAFPVLEDRHGRVELLVFNRTYGEYEEVLKDGRPVLVAGSIRIEGDEEPRERKVLVERVQLLVEAREATVGRVIITVDPELDERRAQELQAVLQRHPGECPIELTFHLALAGDARFALPAAYRVRPTDALLADVERLLGRGAVQLAV